MCCREGGPDAALEHSGRRWRTTQAIAAAARLLVVGGAAVPVQRGARPVAVGARENLREPAAAAAPTMRGL